jgi:hypothetical protein
MNITPDDRERLAAEIARCWPLAQAYWSRFLLLGEPNEDPAQPSIAQIDLHTRQVTLNTEMILAKSLTGSVEAMLAHEIGHHVRYPGTMQTHARLRLLERTIVPFEGYSTINLFTDLMINERLGHDLRDQMTAIYQAFTAAEAFHKDGQWKCDPLFLFYLSIYEELWSLEAGELMGPAEKKYRTKFPNYRAEAAVLGQQLFSMGPNLYTQFLYFLSVASRYLQPLIEEAPVALDPYQCGRGMPTADDWGEAITPTQREIDAIRRAIEEGWFDQHESDRLKEAGDFESRIAGIPGFGTTDATLVPEAMAAYYRQKAEAYLFRPPPQRLLGEANTPTTIEDWEPGDSPRDIDWLATLTQRGRDLGTAMPVKRTRIAEEEGYEVPLWQPRMEIYLDVSGSMPNPCLALNAMTLAAQILSVGTIRAGGWVRALLYSCEPHLFWEWSRSEVEVSRFLMHYLGSGTEFPFGILRESVQKCGENQPIRVVISDQDFDANYKSDSRHPEIFREGVEHSDKFVLLQHRPEHACVKLYRSLGTMVIEVQEMDDFPKLATELAHALFPEGQHVL